MAAYLEENITYRLLDNGVNFNIIQLPYSIPLKNSRMFLIEKFRRPSENVRCNNSPISS